MPKNWCLWTVVLEKIPESPLDSKEIKSVNLKGDQPWIVTGRTDAEAEAPVFWSSDVNIRLIGKVPDAGKDWGQKEKRASEDEMVGWHHRFNGHEFEQTPGYSEGQGGLVCCSPWGCRVGHSWMSEQQQRKNKTLHSALNSLIYYLLFKGIQQNKGYFIVVVVQSPSCFRLFATPWTAALQASLSLTISQSLPKVIFIASVMLSNHLIL